MIDRERQAELYLQSAAESLVNDTPKQAAEALHETFKIFYEIGYSDEYFMQSRERIVRLAEMTADIPYLENPDGSRESTLREKLRLAEMELGRERITTH